MLGLHRLRAPKVLAILAAMVFSLPLSFKPLDHVELFSGKMAVTVAEMQEGRKCAAYDMDYDDKYMNILDPQGFAVAVYQVLRIKPGGSLTLAPVCGTWVWLSRGSTKRSAQCPLGDPSASAAVAGHRYIEEIDNYKPRQGTRAVASGPMVRHYRDSKGRPRVQGASGLKDSQSYTPAFGRAMAKLRTRNQARVRREAKAFLKAAAQVSHATFYSADGREAVPTSKGVQKTHKGKDPPKTRVSGKSKPVESPASSTTTATSRKGQPFVYTTPVDKRTPAIKSPFAASEKLSPELNDAMKMNKINEVKAAKQKGEKDVHTGTEKVANKEKKDKKEKKDSKHQKKENKKENKKEKKSEKTKKDKAEDEAKVEKADNRKDQEKEKARDSKVSKKTDKKVREEDQSKKEPKSSQAAKGGKASKMKKLSREEKRQVFSPDLAVMGEEQIDNLIASLRVERKENEKVGEPEEDEAGILSQEDGSEGENDGKEAEDDEDKDNEQDGEEGKEEEDEHDDQEAETTQEEQGEEEEKEVDGSVCLGDLGSEQDVHSVFGSSSSEDEDASTPAAPPGQAVAEVIEKATLKAEEEAQRANSTTNRAEWAAFSREIKNRQKFPVQLSDHLARDKTDLFNLWLQNGQSLKKVAVVLERRVEAVNTVRTGREGKKKRELEAKYPAAKVEQLTALLKSRGMWYWDPDFPGDEEEIYYYAGTGNQIRRDDITAEGMSLRGTANADAPTLEAVAGEGGPLASGALPALETASPEGIKNTWQATNAGPVVKVKAPKAPKPSPAEEQVAKTVPE
ncbi:unnamed protein product [Cladocopium goreaui]|uniref:Uncharacterized protein n=1 Tax=Cladocopium goreaui TaxID=2562237 RepID=A0A9P1GFJ2_9DINO|nr:unnamed protein product [Cladocopium goreaui]